MRKIDQTLTNRLNVPEAGLTVIYDGQCPFCASYVSAVRLRQAVGHVALLNARDGDTARLIQRELGLDLDQGMLALYGGHAYYGHEALNLLATMSSRSGLRNRALAWLFRSKFLARVLYPLLRAGRSGALLIRGRPRISGA